MINLRKHQSGTYVFSRCQHCGHNLGVKDGAFTFIYNDRSVANWSCACPYCGNKLNFEVHAQLTIHNRDLNEELPSTSYRRKGHHKEPKGSYKDMF